MSESFQSPESSNQTLPAGADGMLRAIPIAFSDIKIAHSVFALPFAVLGAFLATPATMRLPESLDTLNMTPAEQAQARETIRAITGEFRGELWRTFLGQLGLVLACMFFARTWAMLVNRLADHRFDAANPRTARRVFAAGRLTPAQGWIVAAMSAGAFMCCCAGFLVFFRNIWPSLLGLPVLAWIALYSFTKRFTFLCHVFLGAALAVSPIAAMIAVHPAALGMPPLIDQAGPLVGWSSEATAVVLLAGFVLLWVGGFDVAYALQDLDFDRRTGLHSIPATFGWKRALWISRGMHALGFGLLIGAVLATPKLETATVAAVFVVGILLLFEHVVLARRGLAGLPMAFFTVNGCVSLVLGVVGGLDASM